MTFGVTCSPFLHSCNKKGHLAQVCHSKGQGRQTGSKTHSKRPWQRTKKNKFVGSKQEESTASDSDGDLPLYKLDSEKCHTA